MTLRNRTFSGVRWTSFSSLARAILQIAQLSILARLLTSSDFGLVALVTSIMTFLQIFTDAGISNAIMHHQDISKNQLSSLYWLNVGVSVCLALFLIIISPWVALFYKQPEMKFLLIIAACTLIAGSLAQQIRVVAQKNLRFSELSKVEVSAALIGFLVAVASAYGDAGVYAIVFGSLATATFTSIFVWCFLANGWRPILRLRFSEIRRFLIFGAFMIGNNLANTFNSQIDIILGGKMLGAQAIGLYSVPRDLNLRIAGVINPIVTNVGMPVMATAQYDKPLLKRIYLQTMRMTASVNCPLYVALALFAPEIVHLLLGAKWDDAIPLLRIFAVWALFRSTTNPIGSLLIACGRPDLSFKWNVSLLFILPPFIWGGSQFGVIGMSISMTILMMLLYWPNWYFQVNPLCAAGFVEYSKQIAIPFVLSLMAGGVGYLCTFFLVAEIPHLIIGLLVGGGVYWGLSLQFNQILVVTLRELIVGKGDGENK